MKNLAMKNKLSTEELVILSSEFEKRSKSKGVMYALWFFFGGIGGHRYYLGDIGYAIGMTLTFGGLGVWALIDVFLIGKRLEVKNNEIERQILLEVNSFKNSKEND